MILMIKAPVTCSVRVVKTNSQLLSINNVNLLKHCELNNVLIEHPVVSENTRYKNLRKSTDNEFIFALFLSYLGRIKAIDRYIFAIFSVFGHKNIIFWSKNIIVLFSNKVQFLKLQ